MRITCCFNDVTPDSRYSMRRFGCLTDKHSACPSGLAVVVGDENHLCVPEACGRVEVLLPGPSSGAIALIQQGVKAGYALRERCSSLGLPLTNPGTRVEPFVVHEGSLLASNPEAPIFGLLKGPNRVFEGDDGELYLREAQGRWFHYIDETLLAEPRTKVR